MSGDDDSSYIKLPTTVFAALICSIASGGAGIYGALKPSADADKLTAIVKDIEEIRGTAGAALTLGTQNGQWINNNRQLIFDRTQGRYSSEAADKDWREQEARNQQHERRLTQIEREVDRLIKAIQGRE